MQLAAWQRKALTAVDDGHLTLWIRADGRVEPDRAAIGLSGEWWQDLLAAGLLERFELGDGRAIYRTAAAARMALTER